MSSNTKPSPFPQTKKHLQYYINDGDVHLRAGDTLFCVHSFFLRRDSHVFATMLNEPIAPNVPRSGSSDTNPIVIPESTSPFELAKFLWVFYNHTYSDYTATIAEWTSILKIACQYDFIEVKNCAIRGIQQCDLTLVERLQIYELYKVGQVYLAPLYADLCARDRGLDDAEIKLLGPESSLRVFRLRERVRSTEKGNRSPLPEGVDALEVVCKVMKVDRSKIPTNLGGRGHGSPTDRQPNGSAGNTNA